jgi:transposase
MEHYAAIDVSLEWSSICVVDASGRIVREARVRSEREALVEFLRGERLPVRPHWAGGRTVVAVAAPRPGRGRMARRLHREAPRQGGAQGHMTVKTDKNDARGMAQLMRMAWFRPVHVKAPMVQEIRAC